MNNLLLNERSLIYHSGEKTGPGKRTKTEIGKGLGKDGRRDRKSVV